MITLRSLFFKRLFTELKYNYSVWGTVIDWTVALYMVIPAIVIGIFEYLSWWKLPPDWLVWFPLDIWISFIFLLSLKGTVRVFLEEGDQLFLWQQKDWINGFIKYGIGYSILGNVFIQGFLFLLLTPFLLLHYQLAKVEIWGLFIFTVLFSLCLKFVKHLISLRIVGFKQIVVNWIIIIVAVLIFRASALFFATHTGWFWVSSLGLLITLVFLVGQRINVQGAFFEDVAREQYEKIKYINFVLSYAGLKVKRPKFPRKRPLLLGNVNVLFKKRDASNALTELCIKSVLRNHKHWLEYLQIIIVYSLIIFVAPLVWKWFIWVAFPFVFTSFLRYYWQEAYSSDFVQTFPWKYVDKLASMSKFMFIITLPGFLIISFILGLQVLSWTGAVAVLPLGVVFLFYAAKFVSSLVTP